MKTITKTLFYINFAVLLISCSERTQTNKRFTLEQVALLGLNSTKIIHVQTDSIVEINLNPFLKEDSLRIGAMLKSIQFIPLETTDKSLISEIDDILITDSNVYILDSYKGGSLLIFDKTGKFLKRITKGQGPEEMLERKSFAFDMINQELIVYHSTFLSFYDCSGQFKRKEMIPFNARDITNIPDGYLFRTYSGMNNRHMGYSEDYQIFITDKNFKIESIGIPNLYSKKNYYEGKKYISVSGQDINLTFKFSDTIYQYVDNWTLKAKYVLNLHDKEIPSRVKKEFLTDDFFKIAENNNYYIFMGKYIENNTNIFLELVNMYKKTKTNVFRNKESGNMLGGNILTTNASDFPYTNMPVTSYGSYFVTYFIPENMDVLKEVIKQSILLSERDIFMLKNVEDEDNPVIVLYELKEF